MPFSSVYVLHCPRRKLIKVGATDGSILARQRAQELKYGGKWLLLYAAQDEHPEERRRSNSLESNIIAQFPDGRRLRNERGRSIEQFLAVEEALAEIRRWREGGAFKGLYPYHNTILPPLWQERWLGWHLVRAYAPTLDAIVGAKTESRRS